MPCHQVKKISNAVPDKALFPLIGSEASVLEAGLRTKIIGIELRDVD